MVGVTMTCDARRASHCYLSCAKEECNRGVVKSKKTPYSHFLWDGQLLDFTIFFSRMSSSNL